MLSIAKKADFSGVLRLRIHNIGAIFPTGPQML
jgi:hypothetical protein